ncbi:MAG TPA: amidohydrolase family protein [Acidimicrobiales bacterium]|nr:amidohydrolase family protein [Acidimicrobiales bacterium]
MSEPKASEYIQVTHRELPYTTFDSDNHLYENRDALTKFLPREYEGVVKYVDVDGRTKLAIKDRISDFIPNPTFGKVAVPGGAGYDITQGGEAKRFGSATSGGFGKLVAMPGIDAFFDPEPRLALMKEMGIDRTLLWPTLASALEERLADDPDAVCAVIHALNEWMHEHWSYVYADALYATPIISLANGADRAIEELEFVAERGARIFLIRVAPVPTWKGRKSFALPEFDPFWARVQQLDLVVGMHSGDPGYHRYINEWEGLGDQEMSISRHARRANPAFVALSSEKDNLVDAMASIIGHGLATRFPQLKFLPVEFSTRWIRPFYAKLQRTYEASALLFDEDPVEVFNRNVWVHAFHEPDPKGLIDLGIPVDHIMFGSDFPHPEGMADPLAYAEVVADLPLEQQALIMGGSLEKAMKVGAYSGA